MFCCNDNFKICFKYRCMKWYHGFERIHFSVVWGTYFFPQVCLAFVLETALLQLQKCMCTTEDNMRLDIAILLVINLFNRACNLTRNVYRTFFFFFKILFYFIYMGVCLCVLCVHCVCAWCLEEAEESLELLSYCVGAGSSARAGSALNCWSSFLPTSPCDFCFKAILFHLLFFLILCYIKFSFVTLLCILFGQNNVSRDIFIWIYKVILKLALFIKKAKYVILI